MKTVFILMIICLSFQMVSAQKKGEAELDRKAVSKEVAEAKKEQQSPINSLLTAADVGEPDSFGKNAKFLGTAATGTVYVYSSCDPAVLLADLGLTLGPDDRCLALPTLGQSAVATFNDIGRINIPKNSVDNTIYFIQTNLVSYDLTNPNANQIFSNFSYSPSYTIESVALNDPAAIDPNTGLPMNGSFTTGVGASRVVAKTYPVNAFETISESFSTSATRGWLLLAKTLRAR